MLPTIAPELDYSQLDGVQNGTEAQMAYRECIAAGTSEVRKRELEERLLEYCKMDTLAMVKVAAYFQNQYINSLYKVNLAVSKTALLQ